jgi:uncharacterized protein YndB with AHSA1/START domain
MKSQGSIEFTAPPEKIWLYLVEPDKVLLWSSTYHSYAYAGEQHAGVGTRYALEEHPGGPVVKVIFEAREWQENQKLVLQMVSGAGVKAYEQVYTLEKTPQGSRLTFMETIDIGMGFIGRLVGALTEPMSARTIKKILLKLKTLVEV